MGLIRRRDTEGRERPRIAMTAIPYLKRAGERFSLKGDQIINGMIYLQDTKSNKPRQKGRETVQ